MHDQFLHVRVIIGVVAGLTIARLLTGLARFVQHPSRQDIYFVHVGWCLYLLLSVMFFWWFEYHLVDIQEWTFELYMFLVGYAALFFFTSALLFPDRMDEYQGFADYFHARQHWFYGLLAAIFVGDVVDTAMKGQKHLESFGPLYIPRQGIFAALAIAAMRIRSPRFHVAFVIFALLAQTLWIGRHFAVLD